jgi:hypothetical protein
MERGTRVLRCLPLVDIELTQLILLFTPLNTTVWWTLRLKAAVAAAVGFVSVDESAAIQGRIALLLRD